MIRIPHRSVAVSVLSLFAVCWLGLADEAARADVVPREILVGVKPGTLAERGVGIADETGVPVAYNPQLRVYKFRLHAGVNPANALARFMSRSDVLFAHMNHVLRAAATPNDPSDSSQYGPQKVKANLAWDVFNPPALPASRRIIAIVDTGVDTNHPDLTNVILRDPNNPNSATNVIGWNTTPEQLNPPQPPNTNPTDDHGHGTHCAGIAAAEINNGVGVSGIASWNGVSTQTSSTLSYVKVMPVKVLDGSGSGTDQTVADGITWAADHGANIISMSLGDSQTSATLNSAVAYAWSKGVLVVAAAGNNGSSGLFYPAACDNVISVAATDSTDTLAYFSNYGSWVKVAAPGVSILSTLPTYPAQANFGTNYGYLSGTSMATPHVAGEAALIWAQAPSLTNAQVSEIIQTNVDAYLPYSGRTITSGGGRISCVAAINATANPPTPPAPPANLAAQPGNAVVSLTWSASTGAKSYNIYRGTKTGGPYVSIKTGLTSTNYNDSAVVNGTTYFYVVTAYRIAGESGNSNEASATPQVSAPAAPANLTATPGDSQVGLSWNASTGATSYNVKRATTTGGPYTPVKSGVTTTSYTDTGLTNGTKYFYVVTASNAGGESGNSNEAFATPTASTGTIIRLNSGGPAYAATFGAFSADQYFTSGATTDRGAIAISNTSDPALYRTLRYGTSFGYSIPVPNGTYTLTLHFAETSPSFSFTGARVFNVSVNGTAFLTSFDIFAQAGAANKALQKSTTVTVINGKINLSFVTLNNTNALVNAIEITQ